MNNKNICELPKEIKSKILRLSTERQNLLNQASQLLEQASEIWKEMSNEVIQFLNKEENYKAGNAVYIPELDAKAIFIMEGEWIVLPQLRNNFDES